MTADTDTDTDTAAAAAAITVLAAPDSFKGNMSAARAAAAIAEGVLRAAPEARVLATPLADGGEGTARAVTEAAGGRFMTARVRGPLGEPVEAAFGLINGGRTAVLDLASASGIELVGPGDLDPMRATTWGTGELIARALDTGARELIIGIGGSATNDGGLGMLGALGFRVLDANDDPVGEGGAALARVSRVDAAGADKRLRDTVIRVACDVTNPLTGPRGAAAVFGPQKGATPEMVAALDAGLGRLWRAWAAAGLLEGAGAEEPGDGAAGGVGAALRVCIGARMEPGAPLVMRYAGFFERLAEADLVITGEGQTDGQTLDGKLCAVAARESRAAGVPVALLSGAIAGDAAGLAALMERFDYAASISRGQTGLEAMLRDSPVDLAFAAENVVRAVWCGRRGAGAGAGRGPAA